MWTGAELLSKWIVHDGSQVPTCGWTFTSLQALGEGQNDLCGNELGLETSVRTHVEFNIDTGLCFETFIDACICVG